MFISPYDTTICAKFLIKEKIVTQIMEKKIAGDLYAENDIYYVTQDNRDVKPFSHPIVVTYSNNVDKIVVVDARGISSINERTGELRPTTEFQYQSIRAKLIKEVWMDGNPNDIMSLSDLQVSVFAKMLSATLTRRLNLDSYVELTITIIAAYYYINLFFDGIGSDEDTLLRHAKRISRSINVPIMNVMEVISEVGDMKNLDSFCRACAFHGNSVRLETLSVGVVYTMMGGMWFGANAVEQSAVALEHPPTFLAMLYMAVSDKSYRKSILAQIAEKVDRRGEESKTLIKNVNNVIRG